MNFTSPQLIITGLLLSLIGTIAFSFKQLPGKAWQWIRSRIVYTVKVYQTDYLFDLLEDYMFDNYNNVYRDVEAVINKVELPGKEWSGFKIQYKQEDTVFIIRVNGKKIMVNKAKTKLEAATTMRDAFYRHYNISGLYAKKEINGLLEHIVATYNSKMKFSINIYTHDSYGNWVHANELTTKPFDKVILDPELKKFLKDDIDRFNNSKEWYLERNIPYKRCYCFEGDPGNGKTTIALALSRYLKRDVYVLSLNSLEKDEAMLRAFSNIPKSSSLLIEDIDRAFSKRDNKDSKVSFSSLLNCMDGALYKEGTLCFITTNHLDQLDPALIRAGRTDVIREITKPSHELIQQYVGMFFNQNNFMMYPKLKQNLSMSQVQEICIQHRDSLSECLLKLNKES